MSTFPSPDFPQASRYYRAFSERDSTYDGIFWVGIKSTGIFCRPTCPARKASIENCDFFQDTHSAITAGYRPCKRCDPLAQPNTPSPVIQILLGAMDNKPDSRWTDADIQALGIDPSTARRQFKQRFGMTCIAYARARRLGQSLNSLEAGEKVIEAQLEAGYTSGSGFREAFFRYMGTPPKHAYHLNLKAAWLDTPLGTLLSLADDNHLHLLDFTDRKGMEAMLQRLQQAYNWAITPGETPLTHSINDELIAYFQGSLTHFTTPVKLYGSPFQQEVMASLQAIPYGETWSYRQQAEYMQRPKAIRAVARANSRNQLAIIIPCHRVIGTNGSLTGYAGGLPRKQWLLAHEQRHRASA